MRYPILGVDRAEAIGPALRDLRIRAGRKLASVTHGRSQTPSLLGQWERSAAYPTARSLIDILEAYDYMPVLMHRDDYAALLASVTRPKEDD